MRTRERSSQGSLKIARCPARAARSASGGRGEDGVAGVADHLEDVAAVLGDYGAQDLIVSDECLLHPLCIPLPHRGGALYVGKEERDPVRR